MRHLLVEQNPLGMWQTLLNRLTGERDFFFRLVKRDLGADRARALAPAIWPITAVAGPLLVPVAVRARAGRRDSRGNGGSMVVEAVRIE